MNKRLNGQRGDVTVVITVIIVLLIVGALSVIVWKNFNKDDATPAAENQDTSTTTKGKEQSQAGWVNGTDETTGISYATPASWLTEGCSDRCTVTVTKHNIDTTITPMTGPNYPVRYVSADDAWQTIDPETSEALAENQVATLKEVTVGGFHAAVYTGGDGMMAQTHVFVVNGKDVYQFALPVSVGNEIQHEKVDMAGEFVKTIKF